MSKKNKYEKVKEILCEGCEHNLDTLWIIGTPTRIYHCLNGKRVECNAEKWILSDPHKLREWRKYCRLLRNKNDT